MSRDPILVTGATGFVGSQLVKELCGRGEEVVTHTSREGDLSRVEPTAEAGHVYHLAARTYVPDSWADPRPFYDVNVLGTVNVLEYCRKRGASLTLLSSYVYGQPERLPISEDHPVRAFNPYSHTKILAEQVAQFYNSSFRVPVTIVRAFNLYGPGQPTHFLIPTLIQQALVAEGEEIIVEDLHPRRDYIFISDLIDLLIRLARCRTFAVYNAGSGVSTSVEEAANLVIELTGTPKRLISRDRRRRDEVIETVADISRARNGLNWAPAVSMRDGLQRTIDHLRNSQAGAAK